MPADTTPEAAENRLLSAGEQIKGKTLYDITNRAGIGAPKAYQTEWLPDLSAQVQQFNWTPEAIEAFKQAAGPALDVGNFSWSGIAGAGSPGDWLMGYMNPSDQAIYQAYLNQVSAPTGYNEAGGGWIYGPMPGEYA
jgi:hypothetical protein